MHLRAPREANPTIVGYGVKEVAGGLWAELLSVHDGAEEAGEVPAYLYPGGRLVRLAWPGMTARLYRGVMLPYAKGPTGAS